jgi:hypothetical protein
MLSAPGPRSTPQHRFALRPEPQGHGSLRPTFPTGGSLPRASEPTARRSRAARGGDGAGRHRRAARPQGGAAALKLPELLGSRATTSANRRSWVPSMPHSRAYLSVRFLLRLFETNRLTPFAAYCFVVGIA